MQGSSISQGYVVQGFSIRVIWCRDLVSARVMWCRDLVSGLFGARLCTRGVVLY